MSCAVPVAVAPPQVATTTFERALPLAMAGDPEFQNLLGFMHFYGEGAERNLSAAHRWFHLAARNGHPLGQRNDTYMHHHMNLGTDGEPGEDSARRIRDTLQRDLLPDDPATAQHLPPPRLLDRLERGEQTYAMFCAGCHGLNGIAALVHSPSFALDERMEKSDEQLFRSISNGIGIMPSWGGKLPDEVLKDVIAFIRTLRPAYELGISQNLRESPPVYFLFGPMKNNHAAHRGR